jgi:hypothetical protein
MESDYFPDCVVRNSSQPVFPPIFKDQLNRGGKIFAALLNGAALAICARNLGRPAYEPIAVFLDHGRKFVVHS